MKTNVAIANLGVKCANILDPGGKATSEKVKILSNIILIELCVKTIFFDIFGGLALSGMIAKGLMLAYKDIGIKVPVVVRLRGTNEELGQKLVGNFGLLLDVLEQWIGALQSRCRPWSAVLGCTVQRSLKVRNKALRPRQRTVLHISIGISHTIGAALPLFNVDNQLWILKQYRSLWPAPFRIRRLRGSIDAGY